MANIERKLRRQWQKMNGGGPGQIPSQAEPPLEAIPLLEFWFAFQAARELGLYTEQEILRRYMERRVKELAGKVTAQGQTAEGEV